MTVRAAASAAEVDRVVIGVHRSIDGAAGERITTAAQAAGVESIAYIADLAGFMAEGRLTDDLVRARHRYSAAAAAAAVLRLRERAFIDDAGRPVKQLAAVLGEIQSIRIAAAAHLWASSAHLEALATGAARMLRQATGPLVEPYRALLEPDDTVGVLWHRLVGLRYARADAHAAAWESAALMAEDVIDLTAAWRGDIVESPRQRLVDLGALSASGVITEAGSRLRKDIEDSTDQRSEPVYQALDAGGWAGWMAAMAELPPHF